jgi:N-acetylglucosamine-6-phosphate deacetylase
MIVLSGATLVLPDRLVTPGSLVMDEGRIIELRHGTVAGGIALDGQYVVPGFIDVHVHGTHGVDVLDTAAGGDGGPQHAGAIEAIAARLPQYGVTAFCPTTIACAADTLRRALVEIGRARAAQSLGARVLPAHLESNFISADYRGAQPAACLRSPAAALGLRTPAREDEFRGADILHEIDRGAPHVAIVTIAPELDGGLDLVGWLLHRGLKVSLGHSAASYDIALAAIEGGAQQATHLFNRMPAMGHRAPGLAGAVIQSEQIAAELICDGVHVHPAMMRTAILAKRCPRVMAVTDGTAAAGLPRGSTATLGGQPITAGDAAYLADGTLAGSVLTMDGAFRVLVERVGLSLVDAATMCATTPARELGLVGHGVLAVGAAADLVVLDQRLAVVQTYVGGRTIYSRRPNVPGSPTV